MRLILRAAACVAAVALSCVALPAHADPSFCGQPGTCSPGAHCHAGEPVTVVVVGAGAVEGLAGCQNDDYGVQYVRCSDLGACTRTETAAHDGRLLCDVQTLHSAAFCIAGSVATVTGPPVVDPILCPLLVTAAPTVDGLPTAGVLYVDPASGDVYVGGTAAQDLFWDCPPYVP